MILLLLSTALAQDPSSLRGQASFQTFRDGLDLLAQPARLSQAQGTDLWTQLAFRTAGSAVGAGAVSRDVGPGTLGAYVAWDRSRYVTTTSDHTTSLYGRLDQLHVDVAWAMPAGRRYGWGVSFLFDGGWSGDRPADPYVPQPVATQSDDTVLPLDLGRTRDVLVGGRVGLLTRDDGRLTDVHLELTHRSTRTTVDEPLAGRLPLEAISAEGVQGNVAQWRPGVTVDALRPTARHTAFRGYFRLTAGAGGVAGPVQVEADDDGGSRSRVYTGALDLDLDLTLRLLGHVDLDRLSLRFGADLLGAARHFNAKVGRSVEPDVQDQFTGDAGTLTVAVPLTLEARVHPRVVFRANAEAGWTWQHTRTADGYGETSSSTTTTSDRTFVSGNTGLRWMALDRLTWDVSLGAATPGGVTTIGAALLPAPTTLGGVSLSLATSLILTLGPDPHGPRTGEAPPLGR